MNTKLTEIISRSPVVYWLNVEDVQSVAKEKLGRDLTDAEIEKIIEPISENINWHEAISIAIEQHLKLRPAIM